MGGDRWVPRRRSTSTWRRVVMAALGFLRAEMDGVADADLDGTGAEPAALAGFELAEAADGDRKHGHRALFGKEANAGTEARELAFSGSRAFREDEDAVTVVHSLACVGEAGLEVALAGQREDVEERGDEPIGGWAKDVEALVPRRPVGVAEVPVVLEHLAHHGRSDVVARAVRRAR